MTTPMTRNGQMSAAMPYKQVKVESLENDTKIAICQDTFGKTMQIRYDLLRAKGQYPAVGETWIVDYSLGIWTFAAIVNAPELVVTGGGGGGGSAGIFFSEQFTVSGLIGRVYALSYVPIAHSETIALNGINLQGFNDLDYTISGTTLTITLNVNLVQTDVISASYQYLGS